MKKLLLILLVPFCMDATIKYDKKTKMYYSTKLTKSMNKDLYHTLAEFCNLIIDNAIQPDVLIDLSEVLSYLKQELMFVYSPEALILYEDLEEIWK